MVEIYTPQAWNAFFGGSPSLYIDREGYLYKHSYGGRPCGKINFSRGEIYGEDYGSTTPAIIGYIRKDKDGVTMIYDRKPGIYVNPVLCIKGNEVYTYDEYTRVLGRNPAGYIKDDAEDHPPKGVKEPADRSDPRRAKEREQKSGVEKVGNFLGGLPEFLSFFIIIIVIAVVIGLINSVRNIFSSPLLLISIVIGGAIGAAVALFLLKGKRTGGAKPRGKSPNPFGGAKRPTGTTQTPPPRPSNPPKQSAPVDGTASFMGTAGGKTVFACPFCGAKLSIPSGKGNVAIKCAKCSKRLRAKS